MKLLISQRAEEDLAYIFAVIALERLDSAEAFKQAAQRDASLLAENPKMGPVVRFRTRHKGLRFWPITNFREYVIYYSIGKHALSIERVLDGRRDVQRILLSRDE